VGRQPRAQPSHAPSPAAAHAPPPQRLTSRARRWGPLARGSSSTPGRLGNGRAAAPIPTHARTPMFVASIKRIPQPPARVPRTLAASPRAREALTRARLRRNPKRRRHCRALELEPPPSGFYLPSSLRGGKPAIALVSSSRIRPYPRNAFFVHCSTAAGPPSLRQWRHRRPPHRLRPAARLAKGAVHRGPRPQRPRTAGPHGPGSCRRQHCPARAVHRAPVGPPIPRRHVAGQTGQPAPPLLLLRKSPRISSKLTRDPAQL
jgi:hypothetical protein